MFRKPTIDFVFFDAGGGHRSAAIALQSVVEAEGYDWNVRLVNLQELLDPLDVFRRITGIRMQDIYNLLLAKGWTLGSNYLLPLMHLIIRLYHPKQVKLLTEFWRVQRPDLVVSLIPNFNRSLYESTRKAGLRVPYVTVLTDFADFPPHFWMEKQPEQYLICGTDWAMQQACGIGHPESRIVRVSGMILRPGFYEAQSVDRRAERIRLGLDPDLPTALVLFGGEGSNSMYSIAKRLGNSEIDMQLIMICGRNTRLQQRLLRLKTRNRIHVEGFTKQVPYFMSLGDFFIGKPGPGSITEALHMNLPVIIESNAWTLPQERYNAQWVREHKYGIVLESLRDVESAVRGLLQSGELKAMKQRISALENMAVYEVPRVLASILAGDRETLQSAGTKPAAHPSSPSRRN